MPQSSSSSSSPFVPPSSSSSSSSSSFSNTPFQTEKEKQKAEAREEEKLKKDEQDISKKTTGDNKDLNKGIKAGESHPAGIPKDIDPNRPEVAGEPGVTGDMRFGGAEDDPVKKQELGKLNRTEQDARTNRQPKPDVDQDNLRQVMERKEITQTKRAKLKEILKNNGMDSMQQINAYNQIINLLESEDNSVPAAKKAEEDKEEVNN